MTTPESETAPARPALTLDAGTFIAYAEKGDEAVGTLLAAAEAGAVDLAITTRTLTGEAEPSTIERLRELIERGVIHELGAPPRGSARGGITSTDAVHLDGRVRQVVTRRIPGDSPPRFTRLCDPTHLTRHIMARRDVFVTRERAFLRRREAARQLLGATIQTPEEAATRWGTGGTEGAGGAEGARGAGEDAAV